MKILKKKFPKFFLFISLIISKPAFSVEKPNIVFILVDDMGYECIGAYGGTYNTPNIDTLAEQGILFKHAYSQPLSTPSRVQAMTGKYNHKNYSDFGFLNHDQKTFANLAKEAGYKTAIVGKWQLGFNAKLPAHFGFDQYCLWQLSYYRNSTQAERYSNPLIEQDGKVLPRNPESYGPDVFIDYIDEFIEEHKGTPFMLYYPMVLVHDPFISTPKSEDWEINRNSYQNDPKYFSEMVEYMDMIVGRLINKLKKEDLFDNTLVVFTSDNGTKRNVISYMKDGSEIRGGKGLTTDGGTRVPLIVTFGKRQADPFISHDLVDFTDFFPTFAEVLGIQIHQEWDIDGISFLPQITGRKSMQRKWVFCHYDSFFRGPDKPSKDARRFIRDYRYKLYSTGEFYDIENDHLENNNILLGSGDKQAEKKRSLLKKELAKFPQWKVGDITSKVVVYPGLESVRRIWNAEDNESFPTSE